MVAPQTAGSPVPPVISQGYCSNDKPGYNAAVDTGHAADVGGAGTRFRGHCILYAHHEIS